MQRDIDYDEEIRSTRRNRLILVAVFITAFIVSAAAFIVISPTVFSGRSSTTTDSSAAVVETVPAVLVNVTSVLTKQATVSKPSEVSVQAQHSGWLRKIEVHSGRNVKEGQTIALLEPLDDTAMQAVDRFRTALQTLALLQTQLIDSRYRLAMAESAAADAKTAALLAEKNLSERQEDLKTAEAQLDQALQSLQSKQDRVRQSQELYRQGVVSRNYVDDTQDAEQQAQQQVNRSREAAEKAKKQVVEAMRQTQSGQTNLNRANVLLVEARRQEYAAQKQVVKQQEVVEQTRAAVQSARANTQPVTVKSPVDGVMLNINTKPGILVTPATVIAKIRRTDTARATFSSDDPRSSVIKAGMPATVNLSQKTEPLQGKVVEVVQASGSDKMRKISLEVIDGKKELKPGKNVTAQITVNRIKAVSVPTKSVVKTKNGHAVWVVTGSEAHFQPVKLLKISPPNAIVTNGLRDGDSIIISADKPLHEGVPVLIRI